MERTSKQLRTAIGAIAAMLVTLLPLPVMGTGLVGDGAQLWKAADLAGGAGPLGAVFGSAVASGDFDGDGEFDLAVGDPDAAVSGNAAAGAVYIAYGSDPAGLASAGGQVWTQDTGAVENAAEAGDHFGFSLVSGNFNGDAYDDLAIGIPGETINAKAGAGAVAVLFGSAAGLTDAGDQLWHLDRSGVSSVAFAGDAFGHALANGDFDDDGYADLAIGIPGHSGSVSGGGMVKVFYGASTGLTTTGEQSWEQGFNVGDAVEAGDAFGRALAAGDFSGDGYDDLAIGVPLEDFSGKSNAGIVHEVLGTSTGLTSTGNEMWQLDRSGVSSVAFAGDEFGHALASGDFDGDGYADLAVGIPGHSGSDSGAGLVKAFYGASTGLVVGGEQSWEQGFNLPDATEAGDALGAALAAADFDGDGFDDLVIGVPNEAVGSVADAGLVHVVHGTGAGLAPMGSQIWSQDDPQIPGDLEAGDRFGSALAAGDFDGDGIADLALGLPAEDGVGAVNVLYAFGPFPTVELRWERSGTSTVTAVPGEYLELQVVVDDLALGLAGASLTLAYDSNALWVDYAETCDAFCPDEFDRDFLYNDGMWNPPISNVGAASTLGPFRGVDPGGGNSAPDRFVLGRVYVRFDAPGNVAVQYGPAQGLRDALPSLQQFQPAATATAVPEPGQLWMLASGIAVLLAIGRSRIRG